MKLAIAIPLIIAATVVTTQARDIRLKDCPAAVQKTIKANLKGGVIDDIERKKINGSTRYVVDIDGPKGRDITFHIGPKGKVLLKSEDITYGQAPAAVRKTITRLAKEVGGKVDDVDRITQKNVVTFSVDIDRRNAPDYDYTISASGKVLKRVIDRD